MQALLDEFALISPLAPVLSLDRLCTTRGEESIPFDIADRTILNPEEHIEASQARSAIRDFLYRLPTRQRDIVERVFWDGESQAEVARAHGVSGAAISKTISKILTLGRTRLASYRHTQAIPLTA